MSPRPPVLLYGQHLLGLGHAMRTARLARALVAAGERVVVVQGGLPVPEAAVPGAATVLLPPLAAADDAASALARPDGTPPDPAYLAARRDQLLGLAAQLDPGVVILDLFPFGRHALATELAPLVLWLADERRRRGRAGPRLVVSLRDVLVSKRQQAWYELAVLAVASQWVDRILVHGDPDLLPLDRTFCLAARLADRLVYTGYLAAPAPGEPVAPHGEVVVSAGGGRVGAALLEAALAARALSRVAAARPWRLLTGPYLPRTARAGLEARLAGLSSLGGRPAVVLETFRPALARWLQGAALSVSQAGYNTVLDVLTSGVPAVVVPYEGSGDEQPTRARALATRGLLTVVDEGPDLPARLAAAMDQALAAPRPAAPRLLLDDGARAGAVVGALVGEVQAAREGS